MKIKEFKKLLNDKSIETNIIYKDNEIEIKIENKFLLVDFENKIQVFEYVIFKELTITEFVEYIKYNNFLL